MARKFKRKVLAFAPETTYGEDAIAAGTAQYVLAREVTLTPMAGESEALEYDDGTLGNAQELITGLYVTLEFGTDFSASGTANTAAPWGDLMSACLRKYSEGFLWTPNYSGATEETEAQPPMLVVENPLVQPALEDKNIDQTAPDSLEDANEVAYRINEDGIGSGTVYFYLDGAMHSIAGARGSVKLSMAAKSFPKLTFSFTGLFQKVITKIMPVADFSSWRTPLKIGYENSTASLAGKPVKLISFEYDQANTVNFEEYVGFQEVMITDYQPTATITVEASALGEFDPFSLAQAGGKTSFSITNGKSPGGIVGWRCDACQLGRPTYADQNGTLTYSIPLRVIGNSDQFFTA